LPTPWRRWPRKFDYAKERRPPDADRRLATAVTCLPFQPLDPEGLIAMSKGGAKRIRVGIIGANADRGWAAQAHIPALRSLSDDFEITALSTSRRESANAAGKVFGVPAAFDNHKELVNSPVADVVAVTVKVPYHLELATAALDAGKAVYCEWPLANGLNEAETLAALAKKKGVLAVAGLQARSAPALAYVRDLVNPGLRR
jgi:predicted dehydrogenase